MNRDLPNATLAEVEYPTEDGKPMGETPIHAKVMRELVDILEDWYAGDPMTYVGGNMIFYYVEGDPRKQLVPDVFVAKGVTKDPDRDIYLLWREPKAPDFIVEVTSRSTANRDLAEKLRLYRDVLRVREYFLFDPRPKSRRAPLRGFRLVDGEFIPIEPVDGRLPSEILGLHLEKDERRLRLYNPETQEWLLTAREKYDRAEEARRQAEGELDRLRREVDKLRRKGKKDN